MTRFSYQRLPHTHVEAAPAEVERHHLRGRRRERDERVLNVFSTVLLRLGHLGELVPVHAVAVEGQAFEEPVRHRRARR